MFDPTQLTEEELASTHKASIEKAVELKMLELAETQHVRWQELSVKDDPDGKKTEALLKAEFTDILEAVGVETFMKTPSALWEQCIVNSIPTSDNPGLLIEASFRALIVAYSHPDTTDEARQLMTGIAGMADKILTQSAGICDCEKCREVVRQSSPPSTTLH